MLRKLIAFTISTQHKLTQSFPYPFQFTLNPHEFKFVDQRFQEYPVVQSLFPDQQQHIKYVLGGFQKLINKGISQAATINFIDKRLIKKSMQFRQIIKQLESEAELIIEIQKCNESIGYLEYLGLKPDLYIHNYIIGRNDEKVQAIEREQLKKISEKTVEQQLKEDINQLQKSNSALQKLKKGQQSKTKKVFNQFFKNVLTTINKTYQNSLNNNKFKPYLLTNKIKTNMDIRLSSVKGGENKVENIQVITKWYYEITSQQPASVRNSRKRVLFDFQLWNRGCVIPVEDYSLNQYNK